MKTYLDYHAELLGFQSVLETVKTVEKIAASALHLLRQQTQAYHTYAYRISLLLKQLHAYVPASHSLTQKRPDGDALLVYISADKGLAGGFHRQLAEAFGQLKPSYQRFVAIGQKGAKNLAEEGVAWERVCDTLGEDMNFSGIQRLNTDLCAAFIHDGIQRVDILAPGFVSLTQQQPKIIRFLPFALEEAQAAPAGLPIFETPTRELFDWYLQKYIGCFLTSVVLEARLSELSARTVAMEHASATTERLIHDLHFEYFKERRKNMTERLIQSYSVRRTFAKTEYAGENL